MLIINNYQFRIKDDIFNLRSKDYHNNNIKITKKPLLKLKAVYIIEKNRKLPNFGTNKLLINISLHKKSVVFVYDGIYDIDNEVINKFLEGTISRKNRIKIIPYVINYKSIFIKNNKPVLIGKKIKVLFNKTNDVFEIKLEFEGYIINKIINVITNNKKMGVFLGLTVETYPEDNTNEELLCIFGLNNFDLI